MINEVVDKYAFLREYEPSPDEIEDINYLLDFYGKPERINNVLRKESEFFLFFNY